MKNLETPIIFTLSMFVSFLVNSSVPAPDRQFYTVIVGGIVYWGLLIANYVNRKLDKKE